MLGKNSLFPDHYLLSALTVHYDRGELVFCVVFTIIMF